MTEKTIKPKRIADATRWNQISAKGLAKALGYDDWYTDRLITGREPPNEDDVRKLVRILGLEEMAWVTGITDTMLKDAQIFTEHYVKMRGNDYYMRVFYDGSSEFIRFGAIFYAAAHGKGTRAGGKNNV
jgi:hypothetical protein